jgi:hypothetical protein
MLDFLLPHERDVVRVKGDMQAKLRDELKPFSVGGHLAVLWTGGLAGSGSEIHHRDCWVIADVRRRRQFGPVAFV